MLDELGRDHLQIAPGQSLAGGDATLPPEAEPRLSRLAGVEASAQVEALDAGVYRSDLIPEIETNGLSVAAASVDLAETLGLRLRSGRFLDHASASLPTVVLGSKAAERLGIRGAGPAVRIGDLWCSVIGVLEPSPIAPELDSVALIGEAFATEHFDAQGSASTVYVRAVPGGSDEVRAAAPATTGPRNSEEVTCCGHGQGTRRRLAARSVPVMAPATKRPPRV